MDYKQYHNDWRDIIRPAILKRDNYRCKNCGIRHKVRAYRMTNSKYMEVDGFTEQWAMDNGKKVITVYLQIAHIDHDKRNNAPENLISYCAICHGKFDGKAKAAKRQLYQFRVQKSNRKIFRRLTEEETIQFSQILTIFQQKHGKILNATETEELKFLIFKK